MIVRIYLFLSSIYVINGFGIDHLRNNHQTNIGGSCRSSRLSMSASNNNNNSIRYPTIDLPPTYPSPSHTFAGLVEEAIRERFQNVDRVLESWRLLELGYQHHVYVGDPNMSNDNDHNDVGPNNPMLYQECHSYVPGLTIQPFWDVESIAWAQKLKAKYPVILKEFQKVTANREELQQRGNNVWSGALTEDASSYGVGWKTLVLMDRGVWDSVNVELFPKTAQAVHDAGVPAVEVFFASMEPHSRIQPHSDFTNFVLTSHLALDIPYSGSNQCRLSIADQTREWINGEIMMFDTSLMHDAVNDSDKTRYILMFRVWHPDLTEQERQALQFIYDCLNAPEIVTGTTADERYRTELAMIAARSFPSNAIKSQGFGNQSSSKKSSKKKRK